MVCVVRIWLDGGDLLWNWTLEGVHDIIVLNGCRDPVLEGWYGV